VKHPIQPLNARLAVFLPLLFALANALPAMAVDPFEINGQVPIEAVAQSNLNRETDRIESLVQVTLTNGGPKVIESQLLVAVTFASQDSLDGLEVEGALGGIGQGPYGVHYFDLSAQLPGGGLLENGELTLALEFSRPRENRISYSLDVYGIINRDPIAAGPQALAGKVGESLTFDASASSDPDDDTLTVAWTFGDGESSANTVETKSFAAPGVFEVLLRVSDERGGLSDKRFPVVVSPAGEFALARTRTLDGVGHPLGGVTVVTEGGDSTSSGAESGFISLGGAPGDYVWKFSKDGHFPVWRTAALADGEIAVTPSPWLQSKTSPASVATSVLQDVGLEFGEGGALSVPSGAFPQPTELRVFPLGSQTLPFPLPYGWSPLVAFAVETESGDEPEMPLALDPGVAGTLVRFREASLDYVALAAGSIDQTGVYVVVAGDNGAPAASEGQPLPLGATPGDLSGATAVGALDKENSVASLDPNKVTSTAKVTVMGSGGSSLPSGTWLRGNVSDRYTLRGGGELRPPDYDTTFFAYRNGNPAALDAVFPVRPRTLFGIDELVEATVKIDVLGADGFMGGIVTPEGGVFSGAGVRVTVPPGAVTRLTAGELRALDPEPFEKLMGEDDSLVRAFELNLEDLAPGLRLEFETDSVVVPQATYALARVTPDGLIVIDRFQADATGVLASTDGGALPGIDRAGQYLLVQTEVGFGLVTGATRDASGTGVAGVDLSLRDTPWLAISGTGGAYTFAVPTGQSDLIARHDASGTGAMSPLNLASASEVVTLDLTLLSVGPSVVETTPANGATGARRVDPIHVRFSEAINPASFGATGLALREKISGAAVTSSVSLGSGNTEAQLFPVNSLEYQTEYEIVVSTTITDTQGLPLEGLSVFTFTTNAAPSRGTGAELTIYEPGAAQVPQEILDQLVAYVPGSNQVVCHGGPGTADPEVPVILVNDNTGETATVLSNVDGSFASYIDADEEEFVQAVFVNANGTRVTVPATRQLFDTGQIGLYRYGGILEAESDGGPVQVIVEPGAIETRTKFMIDVFSLTALLDQLNGAEPLGDESEILGGLSISIEGDTLTESAEIVFPVEEDALGLPAGTPPDDAVFGIAAFREINGIEVFELLDKMEYSDGKLATASPPFGGVVGSNSLLSVLKMANGGRAVVSGSVVSTDRPDDPQNGDLRRIPNAMVLVLHDFTAVVSENQLTRGAIISLTDENGGFALLADANNLNPAGNSYALLATSPLFPGRFATGSASVPYDSVLAGATGRLYFDRTQGNPLNNAPDTTPPTIATGFFPARPTRDELVALNVLIRDDFGTPQLVSAEVVETNALAAGATIEPGDFSFSQSGTTDSGSTVSYDFELRASKDMVVQVELKAVDSAGNMSEARVPIVVSGAFLPPNPFLNLPGQTDPDDLFPPVVQISTPTSIDDIPIGEVPRTTEVTLRFSEPVLVPDDPSWAFALQPLAEINRCSISSDRREVRLGFADLSPGEVYVLTVTGALQDLNGNAHDQDPFNGGADNFVMAFRTSDDATTAIAGVDSGGGVVGDRDALFVLDRGSTLDGALRVLEPDPQSGGALVQTKEVNLPSFPRDLVLIEDYSYERTTGGAVTTDLLAIAGGEIGRGGQWIRVYDVSTPSSPLLVATSIITQSPASAVVKLDWSPPVLAYLEITAGSDNVGYINLPLFLRAQTLGADFTFEPDGGDLGADLNGDGDYVDPGERSPRPDGAGTLLGILNGGLIDSFTLQDLGIPSRIRDFDIGAGGRFLAVVTPSIFESPGAGAPAVEVAPPAYRTLVDAGSRLTAPDGVFTFDRSPKRVLTLFDVPLRNNTGVQLRDLALVSGAISSQLVLLDITDKRNPIELAPIPIPQDSGILQSARLTPDGTIALATTNDIVLIDPTRISELYKGMTHPAIIGVIEGAGSGARSFVSDGNEFYAVSLGGKTRVASPSQTVAPPVPDTVIADDRNLSREETMVQTTVQLSLNGILNITSEIPASPKPAKTPRLSSEGKLMVVPPVPEDILFRATLDPPNVAPPEGSYTWTLNDLDPKTGPVVSYTIPPHSQPDPDFLDLASITPDRYLASVDGESVEVEVYPSAKQAVNVNLAKIQTAVQGVDTALTAVLQASSAIPISGEFKIEGPVGQMKYTQQWQECPINHNAYYTYVAEASLDPLIKASGKVKLGPPIPSFLQNVVGANVFIEGSGSLAFTGKITRDSCGAFSGSIVSTGKLGAAFGAELSALTIGSLSLVSFVAKAETGFTSTTELKIIPRNPVNPAQQGVLYDSKIEFDGVAASVASSAGFGLITFTQKWEIVPKSTVYGPTTAVLIPFNSAPTP